MSKSASTATLQQQAVFSIPRGKKQKAKNAKKPRSAKKPDPKTGGSGEANGQKVVSVGNKGTIHTKSVGVFTGPRKNTSNLMSRVTDGVRKGFVPSKTIGTDRTPGSLALMRKNIFIRIRLKDLSKTSST